MAKTNATEIYIVDGTRTPFLKARNGMGPFSASDLALKAGRQLLNKMPFEPAAIDEVIVGSAMPSPDEANIARVLALRLGCGHKVPAWTVMRNCASGMQALDNAVQSIALGRSNIVLAGGTDAMSHAPLLFNAKMVNWLARFYAAKTVGQRVALFGQFRPGFLVPVIALLRGLTDPTIGLNMGQTAENIAYRFDITREDMDAFSARSHQRLLAAKDKLPEISPIIDDKGKVFRLDDGARTDSTPEKLAKLRPFFDKKYGMVTAGNSSQITDGAAMLILASKKAVLDHKLPVIARVIDTEWAALSPSEMGLGPVHATTPLLQRQKLGLKDIDFFEINEAFAAQVIGCARAWQDKAYCQTFLGLSDVFGELPEDKLNVDGGAIACGHPIGASGARIVLHLANVLKEQKAKRGVASICIGGGQGGAFLIEQVDGVA